MYLTVVLFNFRLLENDYMYLVSDGDVGALPAVLAGSLHTVLTEGLVAD